MKIPIFEHVPVKPLKSFGITHSFFDIHIDTLFFTWVSMAMLFIVVALVQVYYRNKKRNPFTVAVEQVAEFFVNLCKDSFGFFQYDYFAFVTSIFVFTMFCNSAGMLPFIEEPTKDINTALACGICSFLYVHYQKIRIHGVLGYLNEYREPITLLLPLNVIGEFAKILSMSFRLFGNILGGTIIVLIALQSIKPFMGHFMIYCAIALPIIFILSKKIDPDKHKKLSTIISINNLIIFSGAWLLMFFGLFEGIVQAFVITMLTVTYLSLVGTNNKKEKVA